MSARRIAREMAVILLPQLPKDKAKLETLELEVLASKTVEILCDHARENLGEVEAFVDKTLNELIDIEIEHPDNVRSIAKVLPIALTSEQAKEKLLELKRMVNLLNEALDIPALALQSHPAHTEIECPHCHEHSTFVPKALDKSEIKEFLLLLVNTYLEHKKEIDEFIRRANAKWQIERMVTVDRDILRLACAEAFFINDIPVPVAINEAVELCHRFADDRAARFINGILADLSEEAQYFREHGTFPENDPEISPASQSNK